MEDYFPQQYIGVIKPGKEEGLAKKQLEDVLQAFRQNDLSKAVELLNSAGYRVEIADL